MKSSLSRESGETCQHVNRPCPSILHMHERRTKFLPTRGMHSSKPFLVTTPPGPKSLAHASTLHLYSRVPYMQNRTSSRFLPCPEWLHENPKVSKGFATGVIWG